MHPFPVHCGDGPPTLVTSRPTRAEGPLFFNQPTPTEKEHHTMKKRNLFIGSAIVAVGLIAIPTAANAANGGSWLLGRSNYASSETKVTSSGGTPLNLVAKSGYAPLKVNSSKTVTNLSADKLD